MTPEIARNILTLLMRVDIKGHEVPVFTQCANALHALVEAKEAKIEPPMNLFNRDAAE